LRLNIEGSYQYCLDLGELWRRHTGLPFVFAVCGVRSDFAGEHPELVRAVHRELITCRDLGLGSLDAICRLAAPRIPMDADVCHSYLSGIEFNLGPRKQQALQRFFTYLFELGEARKECLPLKIRKVEE
jgi:chorismate dehydratase